jgi:hypothetical protein
MPTTIISTDVIGAASVHTFTADNDTLIITPGTVVASTSSEAFADGAGFDDISVTIYGATIAADQTMFGGDAT